MTWIYVFSRQSEVKLLHIYWRVSSNEPFELINTWETWAVTCGRQCLLLLTLQEVLRSDLRFCLFPVCHSLTSNQEGELLVSGYYGDHDAVLIDEELSTWFVFALDIKACDGAVAVEAHGPTQSYGPVLHLSDFHFWRIWRFYREHHIILVLLN